MNEKFYTHFNEIYGERWEGLLAALRRAPLQVQRLNRWTLPADLPKNLEPSLEERIPLQLPFCRLHRNENKTEISRHPSGLLEYYVMDPSSVFVAQCLRLENCDLVLDMCAAPGGKTLVLAENMPDTCELWANELSSARRDRLSQVIRQYVPESVRRRIWVKGKDGLKYGIQEPQKFAAILLDAPCSGERHLLENPRELAAWTPQRTRRLAERQYGLASSALLALREGGVLMYSTCSISPRENDEVVEKLLKKNKARSISKFDFQFPEIEKTEFGWQFLPDRCGFGPLYFCQLEK
jgi:5-methylcytosine rRNA methyltransferase NSUN4